MQYNYCIAGKGRLEGWKFYCNTADCIARMCCWLGGIVLQEGQLYCNRGSMAAEGTVLQYSLVGSRFVLQYKLYCEPRVGLCCDTARARKLGAASARVGGARRAARARSRRRRHWRGARRACGRQARGAAGGCWAGAGARRGARGRRHGHAGYDTADPSCDTAGPRATIPPLCVPGHACARLGTPGCAQLGQVGCLVHSDSVFDPV